jgi:hypothetical protein
MNDNRDDFNGVNQVFVDNAKDIFSNLKEVLLRHGIEKYDVSFVSLTAREVLDTPLFSKEHAEIYQEMTMVLEKYQLDKYRVTSATIAPEDTQDESSCTPACHYNCDSETFSCGLWRF